MKIALILGVMLLLMSSAAYADFPADEQNPFNFMAAYTPSTETICEGKTCTMTMYSGREFIEENKSWVHLNDAKSWKGYYFVKYVGDDGINDFEVVDYNSTTIILKPFVKSSLQLNKDIPLKIDGSMLKTLKLTALNTKATEQYITVDNTLEHNYSFGENSTTIILGENENLCPVSGNITFGTNNSGNYISTCAADNIAWEIKNTTSMKAGANFTYVSTMVNPTKIMVFSRFKQNATAMNLRVYIYNWTSSSWQDLSGSNLNPTSYTNYTYTITSGIATLINQTDKRLLTKIESAAAGTLTQNNRFLFIDDPILILNETNGGNTGDTGTRNASATTNYGTTTAIDVRNAAPNEQRWLWSMWNMAAIPANATITNANLSLNITISAASVKWHTAYNTSLWNATGLGPWKEGTRDAAVVPNIITSNLTWINQPALGTLQDNKTFAAGTTRIRVYWNITNAALNAYANTTNKNMSIVITSQSNDTVSWVTYGTKENVEAANRPQLVITYTEGGAPPAGNSCNCTTIQAGAAISCADNCDIAACDVGGIAVTFSGAGTITTSGNVVNILRTYYSPGCALVIGSGKRWG